MVFYGSVRLVIRPDELKQLARTWGSDLVIELAESGLVSFTWPANMSAIGMVEDGQGEKYFSVLVEGQSRGPEDEIAIAFEAITGRRGRSKRLTGRLAHHLDIVRYDESTPAWIRERLGDDAFVKMAVPQIVQSYAPGLDLSALRFDVGQEADGHFRVDTNLDYVAATAEYRARFGLVDDSVTGALILVEMMAVAEELFYSTRFEADASTNPLTASLCGGLTLHLLEQQRTSSEQLDTLLKTVAVKGAVSVRDLVNSGEKSIADVVELVNQGQRFRDWLGAREPTENLIRAYILEETKERWSDSTRLRTLRFLTVAGTGLANPAAGIAASAGDTFILDRLLAGWRPSQFVNGALERFGQR